MIPFALAGIAVAVGATRNWLDIANKIGLDELRTRAERLQKLLPVFRVIFGWKAIDLGQRLDLSKQAISNIETGKTKLSVAQYLAIKYLFLDALYNIDDLRETKDINRATKNDTHNKSKPDDNLRLLFGPMFNALVDNPSDYSNEQLEEIKKRVVAIAKSKQIDMYEEDVTTFYNALSKELVDENLQDYKQQQTESAVNQLEELSKTLRNS